MSVFNLEQRSREPLRVSTCPLKAMVSTKHHGFVDAAKRIKRG
jgi:hypothetical protein